MLKGSETGGTDRVNRENKIIIFSYIGISPGDGMAAPLVLCWLIIFTGAQLVPGLFAIRLTALIPGPTFTQPANWKANSELKWTIPKHKYSIQDVERREKKKDIWPKANFSFVPFFISPQLLIFFLGNTYFSIS